MIAPGPPRHIPYNVAGRLDAMPHELLAACAFSLSTPSVCALAAVCRAMGTALLRGDESLRLWAALARRDLGPSAFELAFRSDPDNAMAMNGIQLYRAALRLRTKVASSIEVVEVRKSDTRAR